MATIVSPATQVPRDAATLSGYFINRHAVTPYVITAAATADYIIQNPRQAAYLHVQVDGLGGGDSVVVQGRLSTEIASYVTLGTIAADGELKVEGLYAEFLLAVTVATGPTVTIAVAVGSK